LTLYELINEYLSPQYTNQDADCRKYIFHITQRIAEDSDLGRKALIDSDALPILVRLVNDRSSINVTVGCRILAALAQTGTYRDHLLAAGVKDALENITRYNTHQPLEVSTNRSRSPFRKSRLEVKTDKNLVKAQAKEVLIKLQSTK
jgi:hypothetical protein